MGWLVRLLLRTNRWAVLVVSFVILNSYFFPWLKRIPCLSFNCYACPAAVFACPIGTLQHFAIVREIPFYTLGLLGVVGSLVGRLNCGWFCPFGLLQDLLYKVKVPKITIGNQWTWIRFVVLAVLVGLVPFLTSEMWFSKLCPAGTLEAGIPWILMEAEFRQQIGWLFGLKVAILAGFLVGMILIKRPFCRFACPLGAIYSPFNRLSALRLSVDQTKCNHCGLCKQVCPTDINISDDPNSMQCIRCLECLKVCPVGAIDYQTAAPVVNRERAVK